MQKFFGNITGWFITRYRITLVTSVAIVLMGALSYLVFLPREGFPAISFPVGFVTAVYLGDAEEVNKTVAVPVDSAITKLDSLDSSNSVVQDNFARFVLQFKQDSDPKTELDKLKVQVDGLGLPETVQLDYVVINAASYDGVNDMLVNISKPGASISELEEQAVKIAKALAKNSSIESAAVKSQLSEQINPLTGEQVLLQREFSRVALRDDKGSIAFSPAVSIGIIKKSETSSVQLSTAVKDVIAKLEKDGDLGEFTTSTSGDQAEIVEEQIISLESNAIAGFIVIVVVLFLLVSWRASLVTALFMPLVMGGTFIALYLTGNTLNTISLFALILVLGLFVDDAIVVVDSIEAERKSGKKALSAIKTAVGKIAIADISGTLTTLLVFLPMLAISGILGDFIKLIPITVIMALIISLVIALTLIPLYFRMTIWGKSKVTKLSQFINLPGNIVNWFGNLLSKFVALYLRSKILTGLVIVISFGLIIFGASRAAELDFNIFPSPKDANEVAVSVSYDRQSEVKLAQELVARVEEKVIDTIGADLAKSEIIDAGLASAQVQIELKDFNERETTGPEYIQRLEAELGEIEGIDYKVSLASVGPPTQDYNYFVQVFADEDAELKDITKKVQDYLLSSEFGLDETKLKPIKAEALNLDVIARKDGKRFAEIGISFASGYQETTGIDIVEKMTKEFKDLIDNDQLEFDQGIGSDNLQAFTSTIFAFAVSILAIYVLLLLQFNSFTQPMLVLMALPFSFVGLFPGLLATDNSLSFFVMIGLIALSGIVVNNTIMLIDFANQELAEGKSISVAIVDALKLRFRALLTTSVTTVLGLLPLALSDPFWESLGFTIVFGLISSTTLVVLAFPAYFAVVEKMRRWKTKLFSR
jgi:HAE1 family hydrophobic/amphiphilic exporter-1